MDHPDIANEWISHPTTTFSLSGFDNYTTYYWRVSASFTQTGQEHFSSTRSFKTIGTPPNLTYPQNNDICIEINPTFAWSKVPYATSYSLQISYSSTFTGQQIVYQNTSVSSNTITVTLPNYFHNYYWRVAANYGECTTAWSDTFLFSTKQTYPTAIFPKDDTVGLPLDLTLRWTEIDHPNATYDVELATNPNFNPNSIIAAYYGISETSTTIPHLDYNKDYFWRIKSYVNYTEPCESQWSPTYNFKTAYPAPNLDLPFDGRICLDLTYNFKWFQVPGAQQYHLQIAKDSLFNNIVIDEKGILDLIHPVTLTDGLTNFWWRLRAEDVNNVGFWSQTRRFSTTVAPAQPIYPQNNVKGIARNLSLQWTDVTLGQGTYNLQVSEDKDFRTTLYDVTDIDTNAYTITLPKYNTKYYWRIAAFYQQCESGWSQTWNFQTVIPAPQLLYPPDSATDQPFTILFNWTDVVDAERYEFQWSTNPNFTPKNGDNNIFESEYLKSGFQPDTRYYWRVKAINEFGESDYSEAFTFVTTSQGATVPQLVYPQPGAEQVELDPILEWTQAQRAVNYHLQVAKDAQFNTLILDTDTLTTTTHQLDTLEKGVQYFWHVSAINDSGETRFSNLGYFTTIKPVPATGPTLISPANNEQVYPVRPKFRWNSVQWAKSYELQVAKTSAFSELTINETNIFVTDYQYNGNLEPNSNYYWRVRAKNESGVGPWSETREFLTKEIVSVNEELLNKFNIQAYPNPFSNENNLQFTIPTNEKVTIKIIDITGKEITTLTNQIYPAGQHILTWKPNPSQTNGTYFYLITIGDKQLYKEIKFLK